ncbi:hypothetical protein LTR95_008976 [Oleoguttula sp. CCFEE 5521]
MGISDPPYLYEAAPRRQVAYPYSDFDPKAATRASWDKATLASQPRPKQDGPLIDFNKHPDSYMIVQGSQVEHKPLPKSTKKAVKAIRWVQFALRLMQLLGATGALICVICVKNVQAAQGWIMRVPPAYDMLLSLYGVYHLVRPAKGRTPASSASYHLFAMFMDGCLIPFYVFIALFANQNYVAPATNDDRWTSFFASDWSTTQLLFATFLVAAVTGGLHLISIAIDIYLVVVFRKIGKLPPDMNPLEENLTGSGRGAKHQYKNSEASASTMSMAQKPGYMSGSTLTVNDARMSKTTLDDRNVPFRHSRVGSELGFNPHNPQSARLSRQQFEEQALYQQNPTTRGSTQSFASHARPTSSSPTKRGSFIETMDGPLPAPPMGPERFNSPRPGSMQSNTSRPGSAPRASTTVIPNAAPTEAAIDSQQRTALMQDNWYALDAGHERGSPVVSPAQSRLSTPNRNGKTAVSRFSPEISPEPERQPRLPTLMSMKSKDSFVHQPLGMNPPTPPVEQQELRTQAARRQSFPRSALAIEDSDSENDDPSEPLQSKADHTVSSTTRAPLEEVAVNRSLTAASRATVDTQASSVYSESAPSLETANKYTPAPLAQRQPFEGGVTSAATPKVRHYGDLAAATRGIRNAVAGYAPVAQQASPQSSPRGGQGGRGYGLPSSPSPPKGAPYQGGPGRVISRSGADIADERSYGMPDQSGRRRWVSGKAAEEGMAGGRW